MSRLDETTWNNGQGLQELLTWGVNPMKYACSLVQENSRVDLKTPEGERVEFGLCVLVEKVDEVESAINRFFAEVHGIRIKEA